MKIKKQIKNDNMTGHISFTMLSYQKRTQKMQEIYGNISINPEVKEDAKISDFSKEFEIGDKVVALVKEQVSEVAIDAKDDEGLEFKFESVDDLLVTQEGVALVNEIGQTLLNGYQLSKKTQNSSADK